MTATPSTKLPEALSSAIGSEVYFGLTARPKRLSPWLFYDPAGSRLFEAITELPEYYLTRTERGILASHAEEMVAAAAGGRRLSVVELGAGTATKTGLLLKAAVKLQDRVTYYAIDVSETALAEAKARLEKKLRGVTVEPRVADYTNGLGRIGPVSAGERRLILYIGSSLGNFAPQEELALLRGLRASLAPGDALLLGVDLVKDRRLLLAAYNDAGGVTAEFNKNVLARMNRELDADFDPSLFRHTAIWNPLHSRMEMHLESLIAQRVSIAALGLEVRFAKAETIHTENSYKFTGERVVALLGQAGFSLGQGWSDRQKWFGVYLAAAS